MAESPSAKRRRIETLIRRFEATIPYRKPLVVTYESVMGMQTLKAVGLPAMVRSGTIFVTTSPGHMLAIPKSSVIDIRALYPAGS
jgi:hypothetical protein